MPAHHSDGSAEVEEELRDEKKKREVRQEGVMRISHGVCRELTQAWRLVLAGGKDILV